MHANESDWSCGRRYIYKKIQNEAIGIISSVKSHGMRILQRYIRQALAVQVRMIGRFILKSTMKTEIQNSINYFKEVSLEFSN